MNSLIEFKKTIDKGSKMKSSMGGKKKNMTFAKQIIKSCATDTRCLTRWQHMSRRGAVVGAKT
jgi:hypothetical protein